MYAGVAIATTGQPVLRTATIAAGDSGAKQTLAIMAQAVRAAVQDPVVRARAAALVRSLPMRAAQVQAIRRFLATHVRYLSDPPALELVREPRLMLDQMAATGEAVGDCDDIATLGAALGRAIGLPARFLAVGFRGPHGPLSHVWAELRAGSRWVEIDTTRPPGALQLLPPSKVLPPFELR